jgi:cytochrome oxidase Cu insertion factor (SCO1/SenC/PrrC family)
MRVKSITTAGLLMAALAMAADDKPNQPVEVGAKAPDFTLTAASGERLALADLKGSSTVVLIFYRGLW